jgi:hypothetical protein
MGCSVELVQQRGKRCAVRTATGVRARALPCSVAGTTPPGIDKALRAKETMMGKYFLGWLLGVPAIVLVVLWFFFR